MINQKGQPIPLLDMRGGWAASPTFADLEVGKLRLTILGAVFLSTGDSGVWPAIRGPLGQLATGMALHEMVGLVGSLVLHPETSRLEAEAEDAWIKKALGHPSTAVIPAPLLVDVRVERIKGHTYFRLMTDDGKVFSLALADPFAEFFGLRQKGKDFALGVMQMRLNYDLFQFYGRQIHASLPDEKNLLTDIARAFFVHHEIPQQLRDRLNTQLAPHGRNHLAFWVEALYHTQRFQACEIFEDWKLWTILDQLPADYAPLCFKCGVRALRPKAKYCTTCGLWLW